MGEKGRLQAYCRLQTDSKFPLPLLPINFPRRKNSIIKTCMDHENFPGYFLIKTRALWLTQPHNDIPTHTELCNATGICLVQNGKEGSRISFTRLNFLRLFHTGAGEPGRIYTSNSKLIHAHTIFPRTWNFAAQQEFAWFKAEREGLEFPSPASLFPALPPGLRV